MSDDTLPDDPDRNLQNQDLARFTPLLSGTGELRPIAERYDLAAVMAQCASPAAREPIFRSIGEQRQGLLPAYVLTHFIVEEHQSLAGQPHRPLFDELAASVATQPGRQRGAKKSNLPLLAVNFIARPLTEGERAQCSDLACMLEFALDEGIAPEEYPNWATTVTLEQVLEAIRAKRSATRGKLRSAKPKTVPPKAVAAIHDLLRGALAASDWLNGDEVTEQMHGVRLSISIMEGERVVKQHEDFVTGPASFEIVSILAEAHGRNMIVILYEIIDILKRPDPLPSD